MTTKRSAESASLTEDMLSPVEQRVYDEFVEGRLQLERVLKDLVDDAAKLLEWTKSGRRLSPGDMENLAYHAADVQLYQGRLLLLQELVDAMGLV